LLLNLQLLVLFGVAYFFWSVKGFCKPKSLENVTEEECLEMKLAAKENVTLNYKWRPIFHT
jgi:hypothetical protein